MKKLKGIWITILTVILVVAMLVGTTTVSAFADNSGIATADVTDNNTVTATLVKSVKYNDKIADKLGDVETVIAPNGDTVTVTENTRFEQVGAYTVKFANGYTYSVSCTLDTDYEIRVKDNGADIPTYVKAGESFKLPVASVWFKSDKEYVDYEQAKNQTVKCVIDGLDDTEYNVNYADVYDGKYAENEGIEVTLTEARSYTVHYFCNIDGGSKYISKDFTIVAQKNFEDTSVPTLNLVNVPKTIGLNSKVTLPKATATDNYDKNVKVTVTVKEFDANAMNGAGGYVPVKHVEPGENGFGKQYKDSEYAALPDEVFESDFNLSFYPVKETRYQVIYEAEDDSGNKATSEHIYETRAADRTAPTLKEFDESAIPTTWGLTDIENGENLDDTVEVKPGEIKFPRPNFIDNSGKTPRVVFELRDTVNNNVVIRFENINDMKEDGTAGEGATYTYVANRPSYGLYPTGEGDSATPIKWTEDGLTLDLTKYTSLDSLKEKTVTGKYTVRYEARDSVPNTTTKTYSIDVQNTFSDTVAPTINEVTFDDDYLVFTDEKEDFIIPAIEVDDNSDAKPSVTYKLYTATKADAADAQKQGNGIKVSGGETAKLVLSGGKPTLTVKNTSGVEETLTFDDTNGMYLVYEIIAVDDVANKSTRNNFAKPVRIVNGNSDTISVTDTDVKFTAKTDELEGGKLKAGKRTNVGSYVIENVTERDFYGFEVSLYTLAKDETEFKLWTTGETTLYTYFDKTASTLNVKNITFAAPAVSKVKLMFRAYTVSGNSVIKSVEFDVDSEVDDNEPWSALSWRNEGTVYTAYTLKNKELYPTGEYDASRPYIVREITGNGKFSLMGYQFSAYNAGSFTFAEYHYKQSGSDELVLFDNGGKDTLTVTESATPEWHLQGKMPTYATVNKENPVSVSLPKLVASTEYANAKVTLDATFTPAGSESPKTLKVAADKDDNSGKDITIVDGQYTFTPTEDGTYRFTFTAHYGDGKKVSTDPYVVKAGDVIPPDFKVLGTHNASVAENDTFEFFKVQLLGEGESVSDTRFTKTLKDAAGNALYTVNGKGSTYRDATRPDENESAAYTFTKAGPYTVEYKVTDKAGNENVITYSITVSGANVSSSISSKVISTILIIVGALLIAGVILYFVRFRKVKSK